MVTSADFTKLDGDLRGFHQARWWLPRVSPSPMVAAARRSGIDLSESLLGVHGPAEGALVMDGSMARMIVRGRVSSSALTLPSGAPGTAAADIVYDGDTLEATTFELTTPGARVTGDVVMGMESGRLGGTRSRERTPLHHLDGA